MANQTVTNKTMTNQTKSLDKPRKFTGRHMLIVMVTFFGVIFTVNAYMAYMATSSWTGIIARNGYVASQDYNALLAEQKRQESLGFQSKLFYYNQVMTFSLRDRSDQPLEGFNVMLQIGRPTHENADRKVYLEENDPGIYRQNIELAPGEWNAEIIATDSRDRRYRRLVRLNVKK